MCAGVAMDANFRITVNRTGMEWVELYDNKYRGIKEKAKNFHSALYNY
jgi:hypothetical protein